MLQNYETFLYETYGKVKIDQEKSRLLYAVADELLSVEEKLYYDALIQTGYEKRLIEALDEESYDSLYESINTDLVLENFIKKAQEKFKNLKDKVEDKGKEALDDMSTASKNLLKIGGNILKPLKAIVEKIGEVIKEAWDKVKSLTSEAVQKAIEPLKEKIKSMIKSGEKKKSLLDEAKNLKEMATAGVKIATGEFTNMIAKATMKASTAEETLQWEEEIMMASYESKTISWTHAIYASCIHAATQLIREGYGLDNIERELFEGGGHGGHGEEGGLKIPFVSAIMDKIGHMPPFSFFHKLEAKAAEFANSALEKASFWISKLGGPGPFTFPLVAGLIGVAVGFAAEQLAKKAVFGKTVETIAGIAIPGGAILYNVIKYTGYALAIYGIIKQIAGQGEKEKEEGDEKEKETENTDKKDQSEQ